MFRKVSPDAAAAKVAAALTAGDADAYETAFQGLIRAIRSAKPDDITPALARLAPVLATAPLGRASGLAQLVGSMAGLTADTTPVLGILVERACQAMEDAARFRQLHREMSDEPPSPSQGSAIRETLEIFVPTFEGRVDSPRALVEAWFAGGDWVQPVLFLCQRADVRAALPQRERLLAAVESMRDVFDEAAWLQGLLAVLDSAPLVVLHRPTGRGFRVTIGGIGHNFQLHTLLAARLIGDTAAGWLPGTPPTPAMIAAADGTGKLDPAGGITNQFTLFEPSGEEIWDDSRPADLPVFDNDRIVVLDPPAYPRSWNAGRSYPLMRAAVRVDGILTAEEAAVLLAKMQPAKPGWTDDLTVPLPRGRTVAEIVDLVMQSALRNASVDEIERVLIDEFGLSADDATLAWDRTFGGLVRASTRNLANCPPQDKDPIAWESFQRGMSDRSLTRIRPRPGPEE
jgi:hypothetical protein